MKTFSCNALQLYWQNYACHEYCGKNRKGEDKIIYVIGEIQREDYKMA
jgi:hypothetical protein